MRYAIFIILIACLLPAWFPVQAQPTSISDIPVKEQFKFYGHRLNADPEMPNDLIDILWDNLKPGTIALIETELEAILGPVVTQVETEIKQGIYNLADQLPEGDPLKEAIDAVL